MKDPVKIINTLFGVYTVGFFGRFVSHFERFFARNLKSFEKVD